ncbi:MAG: efflux RND transporter periplasmic adaptor subunit [Bacteroidetes bacterium]|nr:efflux RND transporter periplasmic adaptor subunit [Bacteroidota bacterium]
MNRVKYAAILLLMLAAAFLAGCGGSEVKNDPDSQEVLADAFNKLICLDTVKVEEVRNEILLTGKITFDENHIAKISPMTGGIVESMNVELGDFVRKGQILAVIRSIETAEYSNQFTTASSNYEIAKKSAELTKEMYQNGLASEKDYLTSQQELIKAQGELQRIKEILSMYGDESAKRYTVKSPIDGIIVERNATKNMIFRTEDAQNAIFTIADLRYVWALGNVSESDIPDVQPGYQARVTTVSYPDKVYDGKISRIMSVIDTASKVMKVRIELTNPDYLLKPEMFANITVYYNEGHKVMACIPSESLIFDKNRYFVMVFHGKGKIETREVDVYHPVGDRTYIESGLKAGELVVSKNALVVYNALNG